MVASFFRMFYTEKIDATANINLNLSKIDIELKDLLFEACKQLEQRGPVISRMKVAKIQYRKYLNK